jgi:hypothetical protein
MSLEVYLCPPFATTETNIYAAYTIYAFFEWGLVLLDVAFDAVTISEFQDLEIVVKDNRGISRGYVLRLPK